MVEKAAAEELASSWDGFMEMQSAEPLTCFLSSHSGLPGPRGNLTLALEASQLILSSWMKQSGFLRRLLMNWASSNDEYVMFVAHAALGHVLGSYPEEAVWIVPLLYNANFNPLWRAREGVTFALEALLERRRVFALGLIDSWCSSKNPVVVRNAVVALAHPTQIRENPDQLEALERNNAVGMKLVADALNMTPEIKLLSRSLGFTISVAAEVDESYLEQIEGWISRGVKPWRSILRENLGKARIRKKYPDRVATLLDLLG
jgi:hypothetical protein